MAEAYIIDAVRTPVGKRGGGLAGDPLERAAFAATGWEVVGDGKVRSPRGEGGGGGGRGGGGRGAPSSSS